MSDVDAVVVGGGPNGLSAAIELARNGLDVMLVEANDEIGGAARTEEVTLPGFLHDVGSAVHPLGVGSPFFRELPLEEHGLRWVHPEVPLAHPLDDGRSATLLRELDATVTALAGPRGTSDETAADARRYRRMLGPLAASWAELAEEVLHAPLHLPRHPIVLAHFGLAGLLPASRLVGRFSSEEARALLAGNAAHAGVPLDRALTGAVAILLMAAGHSVGWPMPRGGAGSLTRALASYFRSLGGRIETGVRIADLGDLPTARATLLALTHRQVAEVAGNALPTAYRDTLSSWRYGPGAFKLDWALAEPIPWRDPSVARAGTVHVGGTYEEIAAAEARVSQGAVPEAPFVLLAQPTLFDPTRAPEGRHVAWGYCHVPAGWTGDATSAIEGQIERFAPGFRDRILERAVWTPARLESWNANLVGGDVNGGTLTLGQTVGPLRNLVRPWGTPVRGLYICSASRPPGGGVHGMVGYRAARAALKEIFGVG